MCFVSNRSLFCVECTLWLRGGGGAARSPDPCCAGTNECPPRGEPWSLSALARCRFDWGPLALLAPLAPLALPAFLHDLTRNNSSPASIFREDAPPPTRTLRTCACARAASWHVRIASLRVAASLGQLIGLISAPSAPAAWKSVVSSFPVSAMTGPW